MKKALLAIAAVAVTGLAQATPIYINTGSDWSGDADSSTNTGNFNNLGYTGSLATSIYLGTPSVAGTTVIDTNMKSVMDLYGFSAGSKTAFAGNTLTAKYPADPAALNIDDLNGANSAGNGFSNAQLFPYGFMGTWGLTYSYTIVGTTVDTNGDTVADNVAFSSGYFNVFYQDGGVAKQVLRLNLTGSTSTANNLALFGKISFDFDGNGSDDSNSFTSSFWNNADNGKTFYETWATDPSVITWQLDTNVVPPLPAANQLWAEANGLFRQSDLNGQIAFNVPEPATLALMGLALAGAGVVSRRRKQA